MAIVVDDSGTQTATAGGTEDELSSIDTPGEYELKVDVDALVGGATPDIVDLIVKTKILTGGTERVERIATYVGGLKSVEPIVSSGWFTVSFTGTVALNQQQGTGRAFPWTLLRRDGLGVQDKLDVNAEADTAVSPVKTVTDKFAFTKANEVDANTVSINQAEVVGDGNATPWDGV